MSWEASDVISATLAGLTFIAIVVALILGIRSIRETRNIQKREFRHRLLNEITEWATKVINWRSENRTVLREMASKTNVRQSLRLMHAHLGEVQDFFAAITGLNMYVSKVSLTFQQGLPEDIQKLINDLKDFTDFHEAWQGKLFTDIAGGTADIDIEEDSNKADELAKQIGKSAGVVLEKVADIKGKEIGRY